MADYIVKDTELTGVANSIRTAGGTSSLLTFPNGFINAINNISGGGGSSDFSTCTMTVNGDIHGNYILVPNITEGDFRVTAPLIGMGGSIQVILCDGNAMMIDINELIASVTGNIQSLPHGRYLITGDCTITIS